jgi:hypothetical protein
MGTSGICAFGFSDTGSLAAGFFEPEQPKQKAEISTAKVSKRVRSLLFLIFRSVNFMAGSPQKDYTILFRIIKVVSVTKI